MTRHSGRRAEGKTILVTGASAGIGYFVAERPAAAGATVALGCRDTAEADLAMRAIRARVPAARTMSVHVDLADPSSLPATVDALGVERLDAVVLNAGILLSGPERQVNARGHESMFATNHLGHFALVAHLAPMLFGFELDRRLRASGAETASIVAHPGGALDSLTPSRPPLLVRTPAQRLRGLPAGVVLHGKNAGADSIARAALDAEIVGGELWGPRVLGLRGRPHRETPHAHMTDPDVAAELWAAGAELTGMDPLECPATPIR